jgi:hypothetical protein
MPSFVQERRGERKGLRMPTYLKSTDFIV